MTENINLGIDLTIPTSGETNWDANQKTAMQKVSGHDHTGAGEGVKIKSASLDLDADLTYSSSSFSVKANTADSSDTSRLFLAGGGSADTSRGGYLEVSGNESANTGTVLLKSGDASGAIALVEGSGTNGKVSLRVNGTERLGFAANTGEVTGSMFQGVSWTGVYGARNSVTWAAADNFVKYLVLGNLFIFWIDASGAMGGTGTTSFLTLEMPSGIVLGSPSTQHAVGSGNLIHAAVGYGCTVAVNADGKLDLMRDDSGAFGSTGSTSVQVFGMAEIV